jgi:hypothetical protein
MKFNETKYTLQQQNIINCGFGADNQDLQPASASVLFDPDVHRDNRQLIIFAERYCDTKSYYIIALLGVTTT